MDMAAAARVVALRPALEALIVKASSDPDSLSQVEGVDMELIDVVRMLSRATASHHSKLDADAAESAQYVLHDLCSFLIIITFIYAYFMFLSDCSVYSRCTWN